MPKDVLSLKEKKHFTPLQGDFTHQEIYLLLRAYNGYITELEVFKPDLTTGVDLVNGINDFSDLEIYET